MPRTPSAAEISALRDAVRALADDPATELARADLAGGSRTVCGLLALRYPGGTVELRVPPFAAVQLGIGDRGRHTRGTPPNVVQLDAATLLRLAGGLISWDEAVTTHAVRASGIRADLATLWPLPELA
ncbi:MAG TPA: sterol carrier family protein [Propionicimonas sp.]|uniref:sterol carrier family protein n=1 Tax=Propionicimonas sp. TaxID=1955623 RepID=UPI002F42556E